MEITLTIRAKDCELQEIFNIIEGFAKNYPYARVNIEVSI